MSAATLQSHSCAKSPHSSEIAKRKKSITKIRNYDSKIRERNRKNIMCRNKIENENKINHRARKPQNMKVFKAAVMLHSKEKNKQRKKNNCTKPKIKKKKKKEINSLPTKYEYGNDTVLLWMRKNRKQRIQTQKEIQKKKELQIQKHKNYILNLNKDQRKRAKQTIQKRKRNKIPKIKESHMQSVPQNETENENKKEKEQSNADDTNPLLLRTIYDCIEQNQLKRNANIENTNVDNNIQSDKILTVESDRSSDAQSEMEDRLNVLKDISSQLQQRLENISDKLHFTNNNTNDSSACIEPKYDKLLLELELLGNVENTLFNLEKLEKLQNVKTVNKEMKEMKEKCELISSNILSDMVSNIFEDTKILVKLRGDKALLLCESTNESQASEGCDTNQEIIENGNLYIESYIKEIFKYCNELDWSAKLINLSKIDISVFIYIETISDRNEQQKIFNNLIFDTVNEVLMELKWSNTIKIKLTQKQIIKTVQSRINCGAITICNTERKWKEHFADKQMRNNRIMGIANEWISEFQNSHEWKTPFDTFKNSMKFKISDMIFEQFIDDIVDDLNQIESKYH